MKLLYDLSDQLYEARVFSELIHDRVIYQKLVFEFSTAILYSWLYLSEWSMPGIGVLKLSGFFIFSVLAYFLNDIKYAAQREFYYK